MFYSQDAFRLKQERLKLRKRKRNVKSLSGLFTTKALSVESHYHEEGSVPDDSDAHAAQLLLEVVHADALRLMTTLDQTQNLHKDQRQHQQNTRSQTAQQTTQWK